MTTSTTDKIMIALEEASQSVPTKQEGWATQPQVAKFGPATVNSLNSLVKEGRAEKMFGKKTRKYYWKPDKGGGMGFFADPTNPEDPYRSPEGYDTPRGKEPGKTRPDGEWNNWGKAQYDQKKGKRTKPGKRTPCKPQTAEDFLSISGAGMGAAAASGAVGGAVSGAASGAVRATVTNMM